MDILNNFENPIIFSFISENFIYLSRYICYLLIHNHVII